MPIYVDTVLSRFPFSQVSYQRDLEVGDIPKKKRSIFEFDYIEDGEESLEEFDEGELDSLLVRELGSNLDELSLDDHLPAWSLY